MPNTSLVNNLINTGETTALDKSVWGGVAGAVAGYFLANSMGYSPAGHAASIAIGHYGGHLAANMYLR